MTTEKLARRAVFQSFDRAAGRYDQVASVQAEVAAQLVQQAARRLAAQPQSVLDIGCGTGFAAAAAARHWPEAQITAIDGAPAMLEEAQRKVPYLHTIADDIATKSLAPVFDLVLSSMALHWLASPCAALGRWQKGLKPQGRLFVALLIDGSFEEWRRLCAAEGRTDGLWPLPHADFADGVAATIESQTISVVYPSARDFLQRLKATGAATPRSGHKPLNTAAMRRLLTRAPRPFAMTYRVLYIEMQSPGSI